MSTLIVEVPFDPITEAEIQWLLACRKKTHADRMLLSVSEEGTADRGLRIEMVKLAVKPYRHLQVCQNNVRGTWIELPADIIESEQKVRQGRYDQAARGTRRILAETGIYFEESVNVLCKPARAAHSRSVAQVCRELAEANGMDAEQAWKAGILHDVTKAWSDERGRAFLQVYAPDKVELSPKVYHSFTAPVFLKTVMGIQDETILQAIQTHTLGDGHTKLDYLLYIADKIEPTRGYDVTRETALAKEDLKAAFELVYQEAEEYRERRGNG